MKKEKVKLNIPSILKEMNEAHDVITISKYENMIACMYASPILFLGGVSNFILRYLFSHENFFITLVESTIFLILCIFFEVLLRTEINVDFTTIIISVLFSLSFIFILFRFYNFIGPAVWTYACLQLILALARIKKTMLILNGITIFSASLCMMFFSQRYSFKLDYHYYVIQSLLMVIIFTISCIVYQINSSRFLKACRQLGMVISQKDEIASLYEEITATEEELRQQNDKLFNYNAQIKKDEERLRFLAYYDTLTELPNRKMILERLDMLTHTLRKQKMLLFVVFIDIDNFKKINDTMGHHIGDLFIQSAADRLKGAIHNGDMLGHIGGDEFILIAQSETEENDIFNYINTIKERFSEPFVIKNKKIRSSASFGISIFPKDGEDANELMKNADASMYKAKEVGKNNVQFYKKDIQDEIIRKMDMENRMVLALQNDEFFIVFQPQIRLSENKVRGFETLIRWKSPDMGIINPMQFIPLAEETGFIVQLGDWILKTACKGFKKLQEQYNLDAIVTVNISAVQMKDVHFIEIIKAALQDTGLKPEQLEIEITESVFIESVNQTNMLINELKEIGISIALDDFGTGYSSLSYLKLLPINVLKIDKSFISGLSAGASYNSIIGDIISLAHNLDLSVIAEGVENEYQLEYLEKHGCDCVQGFLLGRPMEGKEAATYLKGKM